MPINITMPALSPTMEEGNLAKWLVKEGDKVKSGDVIAEIETDKATMEVEAVDEGTVAKLVVPAGTEGVKVNALIAVLAADGEDVAAAAKGGAVHAGAGAEGGSRRTAEAPQLQAAGGCRQRCYRPLHRGCRSAAGERTFSSPLARRLAKEAGLDLSAGRRFRPAWPCRQERMSKAAVAGGGARGGARCCCRCRRLQRLAAAAPKGAVRRGRAQAVRAGLLRARAA